VHSARFAQRLPQLWLPRGTARLGLHKDAAASRDAKSNNAQEPLQYSPDGYTDEHIGQHMAEDISNAGWAESQEQQ
jgi:hypothetical protein